MHIQMSTKGLAEARGGGEQYFIKTFFPFSMHFNSKQWTVLPKFRVQLHFIWKKCFRNINDGS